jgi:predicted aspartyl protease
MNNVMGRAYSTHVDILVGSDQMADTSVLGMIILKRILKLRNLDSSGASKAL